MMESISDKDKRRETDMAGWRLYDAEKMINEGLQAENAALKAELVKEEEAHFKTHNWLIDRNEELVAAQKDAERYRWLLHHVYSIVAAGFNWESMVGSNFEDRTLDAAIDAAIAKENGK